MVTYFSVITFISFHFWVLFTLLSNASIRSNRELKGGTSVSEPVFTVEW